MSADIVWGTIPSKLHASVASLTYAYFVVVIIFSIKRVPVSDAGISIKEIANPYVHFVAEAMRLAVAVEPMLQISQLAVACKRYFVMTTTL